MEVDEWDGGVMEKPKVISIIEYQEERQRTPEEAIDFLKKEMSKGNASKFLIIYTGENGTGALHASEDRMYKNNEVLWDMESYKNLLLSGR